MSTTEDILQNNAETYRKKNKDYGSSWKRIGRHLFEMGNGEPIVLDSPEKVIAFGLFTRRMDKFNREFHGTFFADELNFESVADSAEDASVYAAMSAENHYDMERDAELEQRLENGYKEQARRFTEVMEERDRVEAGGPADVDPDDLNDAVDADVSAQTVWERGFPPSDLRDDFGERPRPSRKGRSHKR